MYLPYHAGVDDSLGIELYIVNNLHSTPFKEATTAAMLNQPCALAPIVFYTL